MRLATKSSSAESVMDVIQTRLPLAPAPGVPEIRLHLAQPASGLSRLLAPEGRTPYWAYVWAGGAALARHILDHPETVAGRRVLDLGAGSGVVAIAAAMAGAREVVAADVDPAALAAVALNAAANSVAVDAAPGDPMASDAPLDAELILVGDLFYDRALAERVTGFLERCVASGAQALVGDPGRAWLPRRRLDALAELAVPDFGSGGRTARVPSWVFAFRPAAAS